MSRHYAYAKTLTRLIATAVFLFGLPLVGRGQEKGAANLIFREVSTETGLQFRHYNGMTGKLFLPEIMGAGAALFDFDNDGDLDVFLVQGTTLEPNDQPSRSRFPWQGPGELRSRLFRNDLTVGKDGRTSVHFVDVTAGSGIVAKGYGMGVAIGDYTLEVSGNGSLDQQFVDVA